ncbi:hypothetical protein AB0D54_02625 [Streptomyces xanthophaeus]|uniref:hypothetical protein n=1 Tax=Streptomyces xanthophaeus TaxID=67385 RepID=UPI0034269109
MASSSTLAELFERFQHEALRLETLDDYGGYDDAGTYRGAGVRPPDEAPSYVAWREAALAHAEPFTNWWARLGHG